VTSIIDLSLPIDESAPEPFPVSIHRVGHEEGAEVVGRKFIYKQNDPWHVKLRKYLLYVTGKRRIDRSSLPDGQFLAHETVTASVHCGTHIDAPFHFGITSEGRPSKKAHELPLEWCYGDGVVLDITNVPDGKEISRADLEKAISETGYVLKPGDIVLIRTGADKYFGQREYFFRHPGMGVEALGFLLDKGIKVVGIDANGFDRPFQAMVEDYYKTGDKDRLWPAHIYGRQREYCHIERLANLDKLPKPFGFKFACFPVKIKDAGAAWARAVAIIED